MNYMPQIINYMSATEDIAEVYLAPKSFIMERREGRLTKISDKILTPEDIRDTLSALRTQTSTLTGPLGKEGFFSFGRQNVGRFRVSYITQRGSYVVHIIKTPYDVPLLENICSDRKMVEALDELVRLNTSGLVIFHGKNHIKVRTLIYSLLQHICTSHSKVVFIIEAPLSFLLKHGESVVIQMEVGTDVSTFEEGLREALYVNPDIVYTGFTESLFSKEAEDLAMIIESNALVMISLPSLKEKLILRHFKESPESIKAFVQVEVEELGKLSVNIKHTRSLE